MYDIVFCSKHDHSPAFEKFSAAYPSAKWLPNVKTLTAAIDRSAKMCMTSMRWLVTDDVAIASDFDFAWKTETWDRPYVHIWPTVDQLGKPVNEFSGVYLIPNRYRLLPEELQTDSLVKHKIMPAPTQVMRSYQIITASYDQHTDAVAACDSVRSSCATEMYWLIMDDVKLTENWDFTWRPPLWDRDYVHIWKTSEGVHTGVYLIPRNYQPTGEELQQGSFASLKLMDQLASDTLPYDIFFISYRESNADSNFKILSDRFPRAQHVSGIKGIHNAHMRCAELSTTSQFWTVDADTIVDDSFAFDYRPPDYDRQYLHLWHSRNPVNGLSYGWGAVKLWPTRLVREFKSNWLDFTTTVGNIKIIPDVIATTNYNCDEISTWRSGFREAVKLCSNVHNGDQMESLSRLLVWLSAASTADYAAASAQGARAGVQYYLECRGANKSAQLSKINDFDWLADRFNSRNMSLTEPTRADLVAALRD